MTKNRELKALIRARMAKTNERYATARARILERRTLDERFPGVLDGYGPCGGVQGETAVLRNALRYAGIGVSEALAHGLCGGVGFLYAVFEYAGHRPMLTIVGRSRSMPDVFLAEGLARCGARVTERQTGAAKRARSQLDAALDSGRPAICTVDSAALPYYGAPPTQIGMSPHVVGVIGRDGDDVWLDDRCARPIRLSTDALAVARAGYRKAKHRLVTLDGPAEGYALSGAIEDALRLTVRAYDEAPAKPFASNVGTAGLEKWARLLADDKDAKGWPRVFGSGPEAYVGLRRVYDCVQHDYSAPDAGRPMFADYLDEAGTLTGLPLGEVAEQMRAAGERWGAVCALVVGSDPTVKRGCAISDERAELLDARGGDATDRMRALHDERLAIADECALDARSARAVYRELSEIVTDIARRERAAIDALAAVLHS